SSTEERQAEINRRKRRNSPCIAVVCRDLTVEGEGRAQRNSPADEQDTKRCDHHCCKNGPDRVDREEADVNRNDWPTASDDARTDLLKVDENGAYPSRHCAHEVADEFE